MQKVVNIYAYPTHSSMFFGFSKTFTILKIKSVSICWIINGLNISDQKIDQILIFENAFLSKTSINLPFSLPYKNSLIPEVRGLLFFLV